MAPPLLNLVDRQAYQEWYIANYCQAPIVTHDNLTVRFFKGDFVHLCHKENNDGVRDVFQVDRAQRLPWLAVALQDALSQMYFGWQGGRVLHDRRVCEYEQNYVVVIQLLKQDQARILTAFTMEHGSILKLRANPIWAPTSAKWKV